MGYLGILLTFLGFVIAVFSVSLSSSVTGRLVIALIGLAVSLFGIVGMINPAYQKNANWRKDQ
jgi:hypothetical protein